MTPRSRLKVDVLVESKRWNPAAGVKTMVRRAVTCAAAMRRIGTAELAVVLTDDVAIRSLNREWRGIDAPTNVLSFPVKNGQSTSSAPPQAHLGDIVLAFETVAREARNEHKPFDHHVAHLVVHGFLHLIGYDHERDQDALVMEQAEREILRQLAIPDPYRSRTTSRPPHAPRSNFHGQSTPRPRARKSRASLQL
jgi:probable rRNA maturation factor